MGERTKTEIRNLDDIMKNKLINILEGKRHGKIATFSCLKRSGITPRVLFSHKPDILRLSNLGTNFQVTPTIR